MRKLYLFALLFILVYSCSTPPRTSSKTVNNNYKKDVYSIQPLFTVFHVSDSISEVHFKINSKEVLYMRSDGINFSTNLLISYRLLSSYDSKDIMDSSSVRIVDVNNEEGAKFLIGKFSIRAKAQSDYFLKLKINDLNRSTEVTNIIKIDKITQLGRQNFLVLSKATGIPLFGNAVKGDESVLINYKTPISVNIFVRYYRRDFNLAPPPFSMAEQKIFHYKADSNFVLTLEKGILEFTAMQKGFYHFVLDTSQREGLTLFHYSNHFPEIKKAEEMIPPLRYITSREEYTELMQSSAKKASVEKFWLNCTGSTDRAKEVIKKYYNRVQDANKYFSSYLEGWKTDRGMVFLIYGSPNVIYRTATTETWIYGEENNISSVQYIFSRVLNPFTDNDFSLERSPVYKQSWYIAVDTWRQGRTYLQD